MERILVFAPHPDDEIIGCGGYLAIKQAAKADIQIVIVSDGEAGLLQNQRHIPPFRYQECEMALALLDITAVDFWGYPDGAIPLTGEIISAYWHIVQSFQPTRILLPAPSENHPDHRRVTRGVIKALQGNWAGDLWFYETTQPSVNVNVTIDISDSIASKLQALAAHQSQMAQYDYIEYCKSLSRLRAISFGFEHGEAFLVFPWDGSNQNFFEARPLISVIIRSNDDSILSHALASLVAQDYDHIEVILVWFGETNPDLKAYYVLDIHQVVGVSQRAENLNIGLAHARGDFIAFLDQDDILYPEHLAFLLAEIQAHPNVDVVYSGCNVVSCKRHGFNVEVIGTVSVLSRAPESLCFVLANSIPNHALLFRAQTFRARQFDKHLGAYEDWDLLAQLAMAGYRFAHVDEITCEYRLYSHDSNPITLEQAHLNKGYIEWAEPVLSKIIGRLTVSDLKILANLAAQSEQREQCLEEQLNKGHQQIAALQLQLKESDACLNELRRGLSALGIDKVGQSGVAQLIGRYLPNNHVFSIVMPVFNTAGEVLTEALGSIMSQHYGGWELCLVDDASTHADTLAVLQVLKDKLLPTGKLKFKCRESQGGIVAATNDALMLATGSYIAFMDHDDLLHEDALLEMALALSQDNNYKLLYTDSSLIDLAGRLMHVYHKPDWSPETLQHMNFINHLTVVERGLLISIGGLRSRAEGSQDWDMLLRLSTCLQDSEICHIRKPLYAWRAAEASLAYSALSKPGAFKAGISVATDHLVRKGHLKPFCIENNRGPGVSSQWVSCSRSVEIIIPTHNNLQGLIKCIDGLFNATDYSDFLVTVIANRCSHPDMMQYLALQSAEKRIKVVFDERDFNWAALNNGVAFNSHADVLLFMNDDIEVTQANWLATMVRQLDVHEIGIVGATLLYGNGEIQHNGVRTDAHWVADNIQSTGAFNELMVTRNVAAVTGACMLVTRDVFKAVNGFDERFAVNYNDVDFCLAARQVGYRVVQVSEALLIHHESVSRGRLDSDEKKSILAVEGQLMRDKWGDFLIDPHWTHYEIYAYGTRILHVD